MLPSALWQVALRAAAWLPAAERQLHTWEEVERRHLADYELWSSECQRLQEERNLLVESRAIQDQQFGDAIKAARVSERWSMS
jgi:hypothetical protein